MLPSPRLAHCLSICTGGIVAPWLNKNDDAVAVRAAVSLWGGATGAQMRASTLRTCGSEPRKGKKMNEAMEGHGVWLTWVSEDDQTEDWKGLVVSCVCGWSQSLGFSASPQDPLRVWNGHAWRVTLGMEED